MTVTQANPASEVKVDVAAPTNGSGSSLPECKDAVADAEKKGNEMTKSEGEKGGEVTMEVEDNHYGENGAAGKGGEELQDEKPAKDDDAVEAEVVKMVDADSAKDTEDGKDVDPEGGKPVDDQNVEQEVSEDGNTAKNDAKEGDQDLGIEVSEDVKAVTTEDKENTKSEDVNKGDSKDLEIANAALVDHPMDFDDAKPANADEGVQEDDLKDENGSKDEEAKKRKPEDDRNIDEKSEHGSGEKEVELDQTSGSKRKRTKTSPKGRQMEKKDSAKKDKELLSTPVTSIERPVRERKTVERLVEVISKEPSNEFRVEKGRGTPLKNIPYVAYRLARKKPADIKLIHETLFGRRGKAVDFKSHILQFSGFVWHESDEKQRAKMKEKLEKHVKDKLLDLCDLFDLSVSRTNSKKEDLVTKLLDFLVAPYPRTESSVSEKDQGKSSKRKRVDGETESKSSGKGSKKKRNKNVSKLSGKRKIDYGSDEDEEDNDTGSSDEEKSSKHSESDIKESESEKEDTEDEDKYSKGKPYKKNVPKASGSSSKTKLKMGFSPKKKPLTVSKSSEGSPIISSKSKDSDSGAKVFSRKPKTNDSQKKKSIPKSDLKEKKLTPKSDTKEKSSGNQVRRGKAKSVEEEHPTDDELRSKISEVLKEADFNTATFTDILRRLAAHYKTDLTPRKASLKLMIQDELTRLAEEADENDDEDDDGDDEDN